MWPKGSGAGVESFDLWNSPFWLGKALQEIILHRFINHIFQVQHSIYLGWKKIGAHPQGKWNPKCLIYKLHLTMVKRDKPLSIHLFWKMYVVFILIFFTRRVRICHCCNILGATVRWGHDNQSEDTSEALK